MGSVARVVAQGAEQALDARVSEAERRGALALDPLWTVKFIEHVGPDQAVVAEALGVEQTPIGGEADLLEIIEVAQQTTDVEGFHRTRFRSGSPRRS